MLTFGETLCYSMCMKLLFITQKIHQDDDDLAFVILWVKEFIRQGFEVEVITLQRGKFDDSFPVHSLGKEEGVGKLGRILRFYKYIFTLKYDRVFVHMNPEYVTLGGWWWFLTRKPIYLWYTHPAMTTYLRIARYFSTRMFAATAQSMPQFTGDPKKVVVGHGIDVDFWKKDIPVVTKESDMHLVSIHRISRSKHLDTTIKALALLPKEYTLAVYGRDVEKDYYAELQILLKELVLEDRVHFMGPVPMHELKNIYPRFRLMVNMMHESVDKTMLEAMLFGVFPITTPTNSRAIGLPVFPDAETPEAIAAFIQNRAWTAADEATLVKIVEENHSLPALIGKMKAYIETGK